MRSRQVLSAEKHPADHHDEQQIDVADERVGSRLSTPAKSEPFEHQERAVEQAPDDEVPAGAVPEAAEEEHRDEVAVGLPRRHAVAAERHVEVVAEPRRQRHVPAAPELLDGVGDVRPAEVLRKAEAEHAPEADRHVGVAGEIEIDLQRVADDAEPRVAGRSVAQAGRAKMPSAGTATMFAISTFLPRPMMKRRTPYAKSSSDTTRRASWSAMSW